ncbi:uncharacterized protein H6S33_006668 [Morchella sextelata]|uniref:uncharacterized protein n=1 Tax=Morchella sextelata TaxID=1174677 RepID=UPI001D043DD4|nr:uncharacterized protein H6S33_006668 [Morchella sextelata]KAH0604291.1 hypothetical protein H6S33_006668 [Morchella sextelata]
MEGHTSEGELRLLRIKYKKLSFWLFTRGFPGPSNTQRLLNYQSLRAGSGSREDAHPVDPATSLETSDAGKFYSIGWRMGGASVLLPHGFTYAADNIVCFEKKKRDKHIESHTFHACLRRHGVFSGRRKSVVAVSLGGKRWREGNGAEAGMIVVGFANIIIYHSTDWLITVQSTRPDLATFLPRNFVSQGTGELTGYVRRVDILALTAL